MEFRQLKTFRTVAMLLSFNRAAAALNYAQSTVSAQISSLEDDLGVRLFDRLGKRVVLTEAGRMLSQYAQKMLDIEAETLAEVRDRKEPRGSLSVRIPQTIGTYYLPKILAEFQNLFPGVGFEFHTCAFHELEHELQTGMTDLAFLLSESIRSSNLMAEPLRFEPVVMVTGPDNPLAEKKKVVLEDLRDQPVFFAKADCAYRMLLEQLLTEANIELKTVLEFSSLQVLKKCLIAGNGVTIIPETAVRDEIEKGELVEVPCPESRFETAILMIWHKEKWLSPSLTAFMDAARRHMTLRSS
jgi:DNA-binding transcriptional LysR family regulator